MLQELWIEEESRVTLIGLTGFTGNMTWIGRQIRLLRIAEVTRTVTQVRRQIGLLA
jgi:hypothetical protein